MRFLLEESSVLSMKDRIELNEGHVGFGYIRHVATGAFEYRSLLT